MDKTILTMLKQYHCVTDDDYENALKQIMQQIALLGLWRAKFFEHAAFYGGTALRIIYGLDRFSEDLDFSLLKKNHEYSLKSYLKAVEDELTAFGFSVDVNIKDKVNTANIQSAFLKANTTKQLLKIQAPDGILSRYHGRKLLKIKFEVDIDPPLGFDTETNAILRPVPFWIKSYTLSDLFASKISAVLCRQWQNRIKGRDWYDFLWFIRTNVPVHLAHLEQRLRAYGFYTKKSKLDKPTLINMLTTRIENLDISLAIQDIRKFVRDQQQFDAWSKELFLASVRELRVNFSVLVNPVSRL